MTPYEIEITPAGSGRYVFTAQWGGATVGAECSHALARKLLRLGAPDAPMQAAHGGQPVWRFHSLEHHAGLTVAEGDTGIRMVVYAPHPRAERHPAVDAAIARAAAYRAARKAA